MPLGSLLGPLEALLGGLKSEKMQTVSRENHFFENVALLVFEASFKSHFGVQNGCTICLKFVNFGVQFLIFFWMVLELLGCLLGVSWAS